ncbi:FAD synthase [Mycoplasma struthionis]|uniref:FAD synthase n=1 Tax=Mycoplasma struthionis TaxID=538220 RepID=A0A502M1K6_9MOLU|nr:riboflavin biosynthesis protein [Mycoplasma struthionis]TPI01539.1 riboflavin biosynthesis protein [Mycoplasma struthionis]
MKVYNWDSKSSLYLKKEEELVICLGSFETLHLGHYQLFKKADEFILNNPGYKKAIIIFKNPIKNGQIISKKAFQAKTKLYTLEKLNFDYVFFIETSQQTINLHYEDFIKALKINNVKTVICGLDYHFGFRREGNINHLEKNFNVIKVDLFKNKNIKVSSSILNTLILEGHIKDLNKLLIDKYSFISYLDKLNFKYPENLIRLKSGLYIVNAVIKDIEYHGLCHIDLNNEEDKNVLYLLDLDRIALPNEEVFIEFLEEIRLITDEKYNNIDNLDIEKAKKYFLANLDI